jgi:hypothetical protein
MASRVILTQDLVSSCRPVERCGVAEVAVIRDAATARLFNGEQLAE